MQKGGGGGGEGDLISCIRSPYCGIKIHLLFSYFDKSCCDHDLFFQDHQMICHYMLTMSLGAPGCCSKHEMM